MSGIFCGSSGPEGTPGGAELERDSHVLFTWTCCIGTGTQLKGIPASTVAKKSGEPLAAGAKPSRKSAFSTVVRSF